MNKTKRGVGAKRCVRKSISITSEIEGKLNRLAVSCNMTPAELASVVLEDGLNSVNYINFLQDKYNKNPQYRVTPIRENSKITY
ncbi:hypothetical protein [Ammoniphilus sp. 3BR4]|uniref:hypothetical protein n=1 Tax=Ammoniphilus sp. 3BR4 TaxID=3158265 RepID=UPI0034674769